MKILIAIIVCFMFCVPVQATERPSALALEWYMKDNATWGTVRTHHVGGQYLIFEWDVPGLAQPDDDDVNDIIDDYEQSLVDKHAEKEQSKNKTKTKLGMTDKQLEELKEALEITP